MTKPRISVFLLSHNKDGYVQEAIDSVLSQDFTNFELWIIENSTDRTTRKSLDADARVRDHRVIYQRERVPDEVRLGKYVPAWLINKYYPRANGDIILYLSDDDLFTQGLFAKVVRAFDDNPDWQALYFTLTRVNVACPGSPGSLWMTIPAIEPRGDGQVDCLIDGGQVAHRKSVLNAIGEPYFEDCMDGAEHCDGKFLQKVASQFTFRPLRFHGVIHRHTPFSVWSKS
jgi:glycosyltransferase involved in cell wall biosynthesis